MICFLSKNGDAGVIRLISGKQSRISASIGCGDFVPLDSIFNEINADPDIHHVGILTTYCDDELEVSSRLKDIAFNSPSNLKDKIVTNNTTEKSESKKAVKNEKAKINDWKCPECGGSDCLKDKDGNSYPCLSCLQIDIAQKVLKDFVNKLDKSLNLNNEIIESFIQFLKKGKNNYDSSSSN